MADATRTIQMIFEGSDQTSKVIDKIGSNLDSFGSGLEDIASPFAGIADTILAVDAAILAIGATILKIRDDFQGATARINASVNGTEEEIEALDGVVKKVFSNNFGESADDVARAVIRIQSQFKDLQLSVEDIQFAAESAFSLSDLWDADIEGSLGAVRSLMDNFGLTIQESFDFISGGFSEGLNSSGDFLESITEYSTQFKNGGADAGQFFSVLQTGLAEGMLGTDKAADAFKEFRVRIQDGSETTRDALEQLGINADEFGTKMANGSLTAIDAFQIVIEKLRNTEDRSTQLQAGVGLLGTQFEDLGTEAALALDTTKTKLEDLAGATERTQKQYDTLRNSIETIFRVLSVELSEIEAFDGLEEELKEFLDLVAKNLPEAFEGINLEPILNALRDIGVEISEMFGGLDLTTVDGLKTALQAIIDSTGTVIRITSGMAQAFKPLVDSLIEIVHRSNEAGSTVAEEFGKILGAAKLITEAGVIVGGFLVAVQQTGTDVNRVFEAMLGSVKLFYNGAQGIMDVFVSTFANIGGKLLKVAGAVVESFAILPGIGDEMAGVGEKISSVGKDLDTLSKAAKSNFFDNFAQGVDGAKQAADAFRGNLKEIKDSVDSLPSEKRVQVNVDNTEADKRLEILKGQLKEAGVLVITPAVDSALNDFFGEIDSIQPKIALDQFKKDLKVFQEIYGVALESVNINKDGTYDVTLVPGVDENELGQLTGIIETELPDGTRSFEYFPTIDQTQLDKVAKTIDDKIPPEKELKITTDLQIAQIEAQSAQIESFLEYKAKVDVAEIEAAAETIKALAEGASEAFQSTGDVISSIFGDLAGLGNSLNDTRTRWSIEDQLEIENDLRERALEIQEKLTKAQLEYLKARTKRLESGESLITVNIDSKFDYALRLLAEQFLAEAQIMATEEGKEYLLGLMTPAAA